MSCYSADGLFDEGVGEVKLGGLDVAEAGLKLVAQSHQFVDFGDDAVLFGEWRHGYWKLRYLRQIKAWLSPATLVTMDEALQ